MRDDAHDDEISENDSGHHFELSAIEVIEDGLLAHRDERTHANLTPHLAAARSVYRFRGILKPGREMDTDAALSKSAELVDVDPEACLELLLAVWREARNDEVSAAVHAVGSVFCADVPPELWMAAARGRTLLPRTSLVWACTDLSGPALIERLEVMRSWKPDPRVGAFVEDLLWVPKLASLEHQDIWAALAELVSIHGSQHFWAAFGAASRSWYLPFDGDWQDWLQETMRAVPRPASIQLSTRGIAALDRLFEQLEARETVRFPRIEAGAMDQRAVVLDQLMAVGDLRGPVLADREPRSAPRSWLGLAGAVIQGCDWSVREGLPHDLRVRFGSSIAVKRFGDLPHWAYVDTLRFSKHGIEPFDGTLTASMLGAKAVEWPNVTSLLSSGTPWSIERLCVWIDRPEQFRQLFQSGLLPHLRDLTVDCEDLSMLWLEECDLSRLRSLSLPLSVDEKGLSVLEQTGLEQLEAYGFAFSRGTDGRFSRLRVTIDRLSFVSLSSSVRIAASKLPQGLLEHLEFVPALDCPKDLNLDECFRRYFEPNLRGSTTAPVRPFRKPAPDLPASFHRVSINRDSNVATCSRPGVTGVFPYAGRGRSSANDAWVVAHGERFVRLHRVPTGAIEWELDVRAHPLSQGRFRGSGPRVSNDGKTVLLHWGQSVEWWDTSRHVLMQTVQVNETDAHLSPDGALVALRPRTSEPVTILDASGASRRLMSVCRDVAFLADGRLIGLVGSRLREFDPLTGTPTQKEIRLAHEAWHVLASPSGRLVAVHGLGHIEVLETSTWTTVVLKSGDAFRATFSLDETRLVFDSGDFQHQILEIP